jgi:predicted nucleotidyltransferase
MSDAVSAAAVSVTGLKVPPDVQRGVAEFVSEVVALYGESLLAVIAFGSAVTGDYDPGESDVNLLVVHASLDIDDLVKAGTLSRKWLRKKMLAPRFLSKRNFDDFVTHFQVDLLAMREASAVLWGRDLLASAEARREELRWQAAYEIKTMRLRIKQQFWRISDDDAAMKRVLGQRFTSLTHLMRAALMLGGHPAPARRADVLEAAVAHLGIDRALGETLTRLRQSRTPPDRATLVALFGDLLEAIRVVDAAVGDSA